MRYHKEDFKAATKYLYSYKSSKPIGKSYITIKYRIVRYIPEGVYMVEETSSLKTEPHYYKDDYGYGDGWFGYISYTSARYLKLENAKAALDKYVSKHPDNAVGKWSTLQPKTQAKAHAKKESKSTTPKKAAAPKQRTARALKSDAQRKAKLPGKRVSASGKVYYEKRANRSDTAKERKTHGRKNT